MVLDCLCVHWTSIEYCANLTLPRTSEQDRVAKKEFLRLLEVRSAFICETDLTTKHFGGLFRYEYLLAAIGGN